MSESLTVELNGESVHAIDAPGEFTAQGPFFVELRNVGGPVHVHLHLDDDLSRAARLDAGNHFVESETAKRVPVGVVRGSRPATGRLEVVTGHGTETAYVTVTVAPDSPDEESTDGAPSAERLGDDASAADADRTGGADGGASAGSDAATRVGTDDASAVGKSGGTTVRRRRTAAGRPSDRAASAVSDAVSTVASLAGVASRDGVAFVALAGVAVAIGLAVIATAQDALLGLVVGGVAAAVLAATGWLLLR